jgi:hypothetical protein
MNPLHLRVPWTHYIYQYQTNVKNIYDFEVAQILQLGSQNRINPGGFGKLKLHN